MHPADERAQKLVLALHRYDLDQVIALLPDLHTRSPSSRKITHSNLKPVFEQAKKDHLDLLHPPADFQAWLYAPLRRTIHGEHTASPRTVHTRASLLARLYRLLEREGLFHGEPLRHLPRPSAKRKAQALQERADITRLHLQTQDDAPLHAALLLIDHAAFTPGELLALTWEDVNFPRGQVLRRRTASTVHPAALQALDRLARQAGGPLHAQGHVFEYPDDQALRRALWKACQDANVPYLPPALLRQAGLRDHAQQLTPADAGFSSEAAYQLAVDVAQRLVPQDD
ncbi:hypothetical protein E5F05_02150 (plasmid) [Deinococcus metallilatus]|uniref:Integrase n=1 Tax=Deinococcus metallilatus TaxID=1211322 RepID=A0ABR6MXV8_9DEIO|nr:hypothetical protein [Deinococcus metallilatus]MBB5295797.1 integrase [Deinococcus metallilatus]QBY06769.1 hypothetical protein E5F05_02150 [Deinococcus metallilatus]GMA14326.1 hypothetical protein GCM10025871_06570 [Deinococcus metallilatus]